MSDPRDNVQQEFLAEAQELVEALSRDLLLLDEAHHREERIDPALINEIFRSVHTLKGIAGMFGYKHVGSVAHALEDLLDDIRLGRMIIGQELLDALFDSVERFQKLLALEDHALAGDNGTQGRNDRLFGVDCALIWVRHFHDAATAPHGRRAKTAATMGGGPKGVGFHHRLEAA